MKLKNAVVRVMLIALLALTAACDVGPAATPSPVPPTPVPPTPSPLPVPPTPVPPTTAPATATPPAAAPTPTPESRDLNGPVLIYEKSGGIAGVHEVLEIYSNDTARWTPSRAPAVTVQLPLDTVEHLRTLVNEARFPDLAPEYDNHNVADDFYYTITYSENGQTRQVKVADAGGKGLTPQPLLDLIAELQRLAAEAAQMTPAPSPTAGSRDLGPLIVYRVEGGIAGLDTAMTIDADGSVRFTSRGAPTGTAQLGPNDLQGLTDLFNQNGFFDLEDRYAPRAVPSDNQTITVTFTSGGRSKTVATESAATIPDNLNTILARLSTLQAQLLPK